MKKGIAAMFLFGILLFPNGCSAKTMSEDQIKKEIEKIDQDLNTLQNNIQQGDRQIEQWKQQLILLNGAKQGLNKALNLQEEK